MMMVVFTRKRTGIAILSGFAALPVPMYEVVNPDDAEHDAKHHRDEVDKGGHRARLLQRLPVAAVAADGHYVVNIGDIGQRQRILVHGGHVVTLGHQALQNGGADLSAAHNDNVHKMRLLIL